MRSFVAFALAAVAVAAPQYYGPAPPGAYYGPPPPGASYGPPPPRGPYYDDYDDDDRYYLGDRYDRGGLVGNIVGGIGDLIPGPIGGIVSGIGSALGNIIPIRTVETAEEQQ